MLSPFVHDDIREKYMVFIHEKKSVTIRVNKGRRQFGEISWPTQEFTQPERAEIRSKRFRKKGGLTLREPQIRSSRVT